MTVVTYTRVTHSNPHFVKPKPGAAWMEPKRACDDIKSLSERSGGKTREGLGLADQTGDTGSAARRESPRKNDGRNEREGASAGATGSSGVDSRAGVVPVAVTGVTWTEFVNGWSTVDVE